MILFNPFNSESQSLCLSSGCISFELKQFFVTTSKLIVIALILIVASDNRLVDVIVFAGYCILFSSFIKTVSPELLNAFFLIASRLVRLHQIGYERDVIALVAAEGATVVTVRAVAQVRSKVGLSGCSAFLPGCFVRLDCSLPGRSER